jgi:alkylation response protein AidB-like acyl-CoA dehydrogenase
MPDIQAALAANEKLSQEMLRAGADSIDQSRQFPRGNLAALGKSGVLGLLIPAQYGGTGAGLAEMSQVLAVQAQSCASTAMVTLMHFCATAVIATKGSDAEDGDPAGVRPRRTYHHTGFQRGRLRGPFLRAS